MYRILIIEDGKAQRETLEKSLTRAGFQCDAAATAASGLKACAKGKPDLVLLDVNLPDGHGIEICRQLKGTDSLRHIRVLLMTGDAVSVEERLDGLGAGADDYVLKPYDFAELILRIKTILRTLGPSN